MELLIKPPADYVPGDDIKMTLTVSEVHSLMVAMLNWITLAAGETKAEDADS